MPELSDLPEFLGPAREVHAPRSILSSVFQQATALQNSVPGFAIEDQEETLWCWAAVSLAIRRYYDNSSTLTQCAIASRYGFGGSAGSPDCCANSGQCNAPKFLSRILSAMGHLADPNVDGKASFDLIRSEIDAKRPVCARVAPYGAEVGHFVVITGYKSVSGFQYLNVDDPADNGPTSNIKTDIPLDEFASFYWGSLSEWSHHYQTKP